MRPQYFLFFFFNDTATTEIYTLSLHDALPICARPASQRQRVVKSGEASTACSRTERDWKSTRLNSSHGYISYAVFCLKKKKKTKLTTITPLRNITYTLDYHSDTAIHSSTSSAH